MKSWRYTTPLFLFVFLSMISLSKGGCHDYFDVEKWAKNLTDNISLIETKDSKDVMECTLERECLNGRNVCYILYQCFPRENETEEVTPKCKGNTSQTVPFYHFMCLTAKALNHTPQGCKYDTACELFSEKAASAFDQTTTLPTPPPTTTTAAATALPERTTPTTTTATTTATTTLPERTTPTTTVLPPTTETVTQSTVSASDGQASQMKGKESEDNNADNTEILSLRMLLMISLVVNMVAPLAVYLYMRHQRRKDCGHSTAICVTNGISSEAQTMTELNELKSNTPLAFVKEDEVETSHLLQPHGCGSIVTHPVHKRNCAVGSEMLP